MDLSAFFEPVQEPEEMAAGRVPANWGRSIARHNGRFPDWQDADIVLVGCREERGSTEVKHTGQIAAAVRRQLYALSLPAENPKVADLGDLKPKERAESYYETLAYVCGQLIQANKVVVLLGGGQDLAYAQFLAYEGLNRDIEYVQVDARFDMLDSEIVMDDQSYNHRIFLHKPSFLFNFANLGYQRYLVPQAQYQTLRDMHFEAVRYGDLYNQIEEAEPYLRMADMLSVDLASVRHAEAPGATAAFPGGFSAIEMCRIARYAGMGYRMSSLSVTGFDPLADPHQQTARLAAMMVWYLAEGYYNRWDDLPRDDRTNLKQYSVRLHASIASIDFFQHTGTRRWWMEVPYQDSIGDKKPRTLLVPCSEKDYEFARTDDIPDRWWQAFNKLK